VQGWLAAFLAATVVFAPGSYVLDRQPYSHKRVPLLTRMLLPTFEEAAVRDEALNHRLLNRKRHVQTARPDPAATLLLIAAHLHAAFDPTLPRAHSARCSSASHRQPSRLRAPPNL
jgi:hypothetical protein